MCPKPWPKPKPKDGAAYREEALRVARMTARILVGDADETLLNRAEAAFRLHDDVTFARGAFWQVVRGGVTL